MKTLFLRNLKNYVNDYIMNTKIKTGGNFWGDEEEKEYTVEQFIKKELKNRLESKTLKVKRRNSTQIPKVFLLKNILINNLILTK